MLKRVTHKNFSSLNRNLRSHSEPHKCPLSVLWRCPSYREFGYSKMTEKRPGPAPGVRLIEVSVKRELTVYIKQISSFSSISRYNVAFKLIIIL